MKPEVDPLFPAAHYQDGRDLFNGNRTYYELEPGQVKPGARTFPKMKDGCCHKTVIERCSDCSFRDPVTGSIGSP